MYAGRYIVIMSEPTQKHPAEEKDTKEARLENPSGVLHLFGHDSVPILLDALLTLPPGREFNKTEFADHAGVTRQTVSNYIDLLLETDVVEEVPNTSPRRYRVAKSDVVQELFELNSALNAAGE
jgi:Fic family protein